MRRLSVLFTLSAVAFGADWVFFRSGPFEVHTDTDRKRAREVLNHLEQLRWMYGQFTGKPEPKTLWPVRVFVTKTGAPGFRLGRDGWVGVLRPGDDVPPEWNAAVIRTLLDDNSGRMPDAIESGLIAALSTAEVSGVHVIVGQPPAQPTLDWARVHLLLTDENYRGRVRILFSNLERAVDPAVAFPNSLGKTRDEIEKEAQAHLAAKTVPTADIAGKPLNLNRDFQQREGDAAQAAAWISDTKPTVPVTARDFVAAANAALAARQDPKPNLELAIKAKPDWAEPYRLLASQEPDAGRKAGLLKRAAELSPRDYELWTSLAVLFTEYNRFADADKAWAAAEKAAGEPARRAAIRARRQALAVQREDVEDEIRRETKLAKEREVQNLKNEAVAALREAEAKANEGQQPLDSSVKVEQWWDGPKPDATLDGVLKRVDCLGKRLRLVVESGAKLHQFLVPDPQKLVLTGMAETTLSCGVQRAARKVKVDYFAKPNAATQTAGEAAVLTFP